ncbi:MAG TPA: sensor histidine kinase N-terminal domain-containing protein [Herbaspirillum sp.]|jgi:two-component system sensor histidine kinase TctE
MMRDIDSPAAPGNERAQHSLFGEILDWMLAPLLLLWPMSIAITYLIAQSIANQPFDRALEDNVTVLAQQVTENNGKIGTNMVSSARDLLRADEIDTIYFQISDINGAYVDGDRDIPQPPAMDEKLPAGAVQFYNTVLHGADIRVAYAKVDLRSRAQRNHDRRIGRGNDAQPERLALVQVGETLDKRAQLANDIIKGVILPQFIILPIALALIWFALARGLSPLSELQRRVRMRRPDDLSPIETRQVPEEISPLVRSLNEMLARLAQTIDVQKRFIADAAHQMKTPLAGMRMQAELALRQTDRNDIHRSLEQVAKSSEAATRLVNQLLSLARAENVQTQSGTPANVDLSVLARSVMHDLVPLSFSRQIDLGFEQSPQMVTIPGDPVMLRELLVNLLDNALRYTPRKGSITVRTRLDEIRGIAMLEVEDTGPGIPPAERRLVFDRFYRVLGTHSPGSGLGLSIVREIAQQHNATVEISNNPRSQPEFPGSLFRVSFKLPQGT